MFKSLILTLYLFIRLRIKDDILSMFYLYLIRNLKLKVINKNEFTINNNFFTSAEFFKHFLY